MKLEIYYDRENDALKRVIDGILINHDEGIQSNKFFISYFGNDIENVEDIKNVSSEDIMEGYDALLIAFREIETEDFVKEHFKIFRKEKIQGELLVNRDINAKWINSTFGEMELIFLDNNEVYCLM